MGKVDVAEAFKDAFEFWKAHWRGALAAQLTLVACRVVQVAAGPSAPWLAGLASFVDPVIYLMVAGALYRLALQPDHPGATAFRPGRGGFQWRAWEWDFLMLGIGVSLLLLLLGAVFVIAVIADGGLDKAPSPEDLLSRSSPSEIIVLVLVGCVLVYLFARLSLAPQLVLETGRGDFGWSLTRGYGGHLFAALVIFLAAQRAVDYGFGKLGELSGGKDTDWATALLARLWEAFVSMPVYIGLTTSLYRTLRGPIAVAAPEPAA